MATSSGTAGSVIVLTGGSNTLVGEITEWSLAASQDTVDVSAFGEADRRYVTIQRGASGSFMGNFDDADTGQMAIQDHLLAGSSAHILLYDADTNYAELVYAWITGEGPATSIDGVAGVAYDFTVSRTIETSTSLSKLLLESGDVLLMEDGAGVRLESYLTWGS